MIEVELPDGSVAEFPDGTTPDVIKGALQKRFGAPARQPEAAPTQQPAMAKTSRLPEERGLFRRIDDGVRGVADMMTFGFADEIAAKANELTGLGGGYDENLVNERARDATGGAERFAGQLAGAVMIPGGSARSVGGAALQGGIMGGAYGFGSGEGDVNNRMMNAAVGGALGGAAGGAVRGVANKLGERAARASIPSNDQLRAAGQAAYKAADDAGVIIRPESTQRLTAAITDDLAEFGFDPALQPGIGAVLNRLQGLGDQNVTLKGMDVIRRVAGNAAQSYDNPSQKALAGKIMSRIDDFIGDLSPNDVLAGNSKEAANQMLKARSMWTRLKKAEMVDTALLKADRRAASTGSGGNADNAMRQNVRGLLDNPRTARGMSKTERAAAEKVVRGSRTQNALRLAGKLSPQGNGLMAALGVGGAMVNPAIGGLALGGMGAKSVADSMTVKAVERLSEIIRSGGMTAAQLAAAVRSGQIPADAAQAAIERANAMIQMPASRMAATGAERRPLEITVTPNR